MSLYSKKELEKQMAFLAYYFHWSLQDIEELTHLERERYIAEISRINRTISKGASSIFDVE